MSREDHKSLDGDGVVDSEPLMVHEHWSSKATWKLKTTARLSRAQKFCLAIWSARYMLDTALLLVILLVILLRSANVDSQSQLETSGDITGFAPTIRRQIKTFVDDPSFTPHDPADWFTHRVRNKWLELVPKGLGYVKIDNPEDYDNLPTPLPEYDSTVFTTSVTHQLHCLYKLEELFASMMSNNTGDSIPESSGWHSRHCFEYLRQSILCCGDTALEGKQTSFPDKDTPGSDGWDAKHVCRDYDQVRTHLEKNRIDDEVWI